ncbi:hypothetical protein B0T14DRAFT_259835 [Immersiella caudata]|uniref:Uncharacterized protein n=1 Tax=Immersiella caudata TaxID=314043 RepID=A0AA39WKQ2_9PEZI|nr:hypothetical protein B0T14DRAFT_259835 [Immersiella caudata]
MRRLHIPCNSLEANRRHLLATGEEYATATISEESGVSVSPPPSTTRPDGHPLLGCGPNVPPSHTGTPIRPWYRCHQTHIAILLDVPIPSMHSGYRSIIKHDVTSGSSPMTRPVRRCATTPPLSASIESTLVCCVMDHSMPPANRSGEMEPTIRPSWAGGSHHPILKSSSTWATSSGWISVGVLPAEIDLIAGGCGRPLGPLCPLWV